MKIFFCCWNCQSIYNYYNKLFRRKVCLSQVILSKKCLQKMALAFEFLVQSDP